MSSVANAQNTINVVIITDKQDNTAEYPTDNIIRMFSSTSNHTIELHDNTLVVIPLKDIKDLQVSKQPSNGYTWVDMAKGKTFATGTYQSELDASPIVNNTSVSYVDSYTWWRKNKVKNPKGYVVFIHDDCPESDYTGNRKIYSKYDFKTSFCYILRPFTSIKEKARRISNIQQMISEGHEFGLHALFGKSYWRTNKLFDLKPNGGSNFAPQLVDLRALGTTSIVSSQYATAGSYSNITFESLDEGTLNELNALYTLYGDNSHLSGLDLNDVIQSKTPLSWLEYWYNELIDPSLGYSSTAETIADRFAADYEIPIDADINTYYPDKEHLLNGKMIYYADTTNPNYDNPEYQKVGKFVRGLFKGSYSTCNYEVMDKVLEVFRAFMYHYYGTCNISDCHAHGGYYCKMVYKNNNIRYDNNEKTIVHGAYGRFYKSSEGQFLNEIDLFERYGMCQNVCSSHFWANGYEGEIGLFYGIDDIADNRCNDTSGNPDLRINFRGYLNIFGTAVSETMDYNTFANYVNGIDNWTKFFYDNHGQQMTKNGDTKTIFNTLFRSINIIKACIGTGKIPVLKFDSNKKNPAISTALDLLLRFCYNNDIEVIGADKAKKLCSTLSHNYASNLFPNVEFKQMALDYMGGESPEPEAYLPDSWMPIGEIAKGQYDIAISTINSSKQMEVTSVDEKGTAIGTSVWGLQPGNYTLRYRAKSMSGNSELRIVLKTGGMRISSYPINTSNVLGTEYQDYEMHFTIPAFVRHPITSESSGVQLLCNGYEDNVQRVVFALKVSANDTLFFTNPSLTKDN